MTSWKELIVKALVALGGEGHLDEIYGEVAGRRTALSEHWQSTVRRTLQQASSDTTSFVPQYGDIFYSRGIGTGRWGLRATRDVDPLGEGVVQNPGARQGYVLDSRVRRAIERHAVNAAIAYYSGLGATDIFELGKPYDLRMTLDGIETHVEVKGSTQDLEYVTLTRNEVRHARDHAGTQLYVVDQIRLATTESGEVTTAAGRERVWSSWVPDDASLTPMVFQHRLPV